MHVGIKQKHYQIDHQSQPESNHLEKFEPLSLKWFGTSASSI
jgi:hypothetical protein